MYKTLIEALNKRYATKHFDTNKKISKLHIDTIIEAIRLTPSAFGLQLMKTVLVENIELREQLLVHSYGQRQVVEASHLIVLCRESNFTDEHIDLYLEDIVKTRGIKIDQLNGFKNMLVNYKNDKSNTELNNWMTQQTYIALGNLLTTCAVLSIDACPMEGFLSVEFDKILGLKAKHLVSTLVIPIGYAVKNDKTINQKKVRRDINNFLIVK